MKQIPLLQGKALLIELPDGSEFPRIGNGVLKAERTHDDYSVSLVRLSLPPGNWRIIGMLSEVRESEASKLVKYTGLGGYVDSYENYQNRGYLFLPTAIKSLESSILAEGYYLDKNPNGEKRPSINDYSSLVQYQGDAADFDKAQSRVLDRNRCLLLGRKYV